MKKIIICVLSLIMLSVTCYFLHLHVRKMSENYVEKKKKSLHGEFYDKLNECWGGEPRLMFSEVYGGTSYIPMDMDAVRFIDNRDVKDMSFYATVENLFPYDRFPLLIPTMFKRLSPGSFKQIYELNAVKEVPWVAYLLKYIDKDKFQMFVFKPVAVGYLQSSIHLRDWKPSLDESCIDALEYLIKEDRDYKDCYNQNNKRIINQLLDLNNPYYYIQEETIYEKFQRGDYVNFSDIRPTTHPENDPFNGHHISWIYNGFYRVYYDIYPLCTYEVSFNHLNYENDKNSYYEENFFVIRICFWILFFMIFLYMIFCFNKYRSNVNRVNSNDNDELIISNLYNEILEKANPKKFIEPYQPIKLAIANDIYSKAIKNRYNRVVLDELLNRIKKEL